MQQPPVRISSRPNKAIINADIFKEKLIVLPSCPRKTSHAKKGRSITERFADSCSSSSSIYAKKARSHIEQLADFYSINQEEHFSGELIPSSSILSSSNVVGATGELIPSSPILSSSTNVVGATQEREMSEYERLRAKNLARNKAFESDLFGGFSILLPRPTKVHANHKRSLLERVINGPSRISSRSTKLDVNKQFMKQSGSRLQINNYFCSTHISQQESVLSTNLEPTDKFRYRFMFKCPHCKSNVRVDRIISNVPEKLELAKTEALQLHYIRTGCTPEHPSSEEHYGEERRYYSVEESYNFEQEEHQELDPSEDGSESVNEEHNDEERRSEEEEEEEAGEEERGKGDAEMPIDIYPPVLLEYEQAKAANHGNLNPALHDILDFQEQFIKSLRKNPLIGDTRRGTPDDYIEVYKLVHSLGLTINEGTEVMNSIKRVLKNNGVVNECLPKSMQTIEDAVNMRHMKLTYRKPRTLYYPLPETYFGRRGRNLSDRQYLKAPKGVCFDIFERIGYALLQIPDESYMNLMPNTHYASRANIHEDATSLNRGAAAKIYADFHTGNKAARLCKKVLVQ
jgi:hypothetical protein